MYCVYIYIYITQPSKKGKQLKAGGSNFETCPNYKLTIVSISNQAQAAPNLVSLLPGLLTATW